MTSARDFGATLALATLFLSFSAAAAPRRSVDTIVEGRRSAALLRSKVAYADLDLTRKKDERQLVRRVSAAINRACPEDSVVEKHQCRNQAWLKARRQIRQAVYNARNMVGYVESTSMVILLPAGEDSAIAAQAR